MHEKILIVDDDESLLKIVTFRLKEAGFETTSCSSGKEALEAMKSKEFDLLLTDVKMPDMDGMKLLEKSRKLRPDMPVVMITAFAAIDAAVEAVKAGAFDYIPKPFAVEDLLNKVNRALEAGRLKIENALLKSQLAQHDKLDEIVGQSEVIRSLYDMIDRVAQGDSNIVIYGESGTGKELVARAIHRMSLRSTKPMVAINCSAIPRDLLESELFGHIRGAFTGAIRDRVGVFEQADGGSLFLDEIGDISLDLQPKLLRAIQEREVVRVGDSKPRKFDVRLITATKSDLKSMVELGTFREDLYYRINVIPITVPPLRDRKDDIATLAAHFLKKHFPDKKLRLDPDTLKKLERYGWPGNVRELENAIQRAGVLCKEEVIYQHQLPEEISSETARTMQTSISTFKSLFKAEASVIQNALDKAHGNRAEAARLLGIPRHVLIYRLKKYGLG